MMRDERDQPAVYWKRQQIGVGVTRVPVDDDRAGQPLRTNMGYVERRDEREASWREAS